MVSSTSADIPRNAGRLPHRHAALHEQVAARLDKPAVIFVGSDIATYAIDSHFPRPLLPEGALRALSFERFIMGLTDAMALIERSRRAHMTPGGFATLGPSGGQCPVDQRSRVPRRRN